MYLNSLIGLNKLVQNTKEYKRQKRPTAKSLLIDRCNFVIDCINSSNRHKKGIKADFEPVPIHSNTLIIYLGRNYKAILNLLKRLDIITVNDSYLSTLEALKRSENNETQVFPESKKYSLTKKALKMDLDKVGVLSKATERRLKKHKEEHIKQYVKHPIHAKVLNNLNQVKYEGDVITLNWKSEEQSLYYQKSFKDLKRWNKKPLDKLILDHNFYYAPSKYGRVYHSLATLPKAYFERLTHKDGSKLSEIDLRQAQPFIIALMYSKASNDTMILKDFINQDWYKLVSEFCKRNGFQSLGDLYDTNRGEFKKTIIADAFYSPSNRKRPMQVLKQMYPSFAQWIIDYKTKHGYKAISQNAQNVEASIFVWGLFKDLNDEFCITKHDSILVKTTEVKYFKQKLIKIMQDKFTFVDPEAFNNVLKITNYE